MAILSKYVYAFVDWGMGGSMLKDRGFFLAFVLKMRFIVSSDYTVYPKFWYQLLKPSLTFTMCLIYIAEYSFLSSFTNVSSKIGCMFLATLGN